MPRTTSNDFLLPTNAKAIRAAISRSHNDAVSEYRIKGVRGLVLHVLPSGTATWYAHYDIVRGKSRLRRKLKLGRHDELSLAQAIRAAEETRSLVQQGTDPAGQKTETRRGLTFADLVDHRFAKGDPLRPATKQDYDDILKTDILPFIGAVPANTVTRADVIGVLDRISDRGATRRADKAKAIIGSIYNFGIDRNLVDSNPASGLRNRHDNMPRDVVAEDEHVRKLWTAMDEGRLSMSSAMVHIVKLGLLTGLRRTEIAALRKAEVELCGPSPLLTIPRGRAKNRNAHRVPLSPAAVEVLSAAINASTDSDYVFPTAGGGTHVTPRSVSKAIERARQDLGISDVTMHDLRRTVGTAMSRFGVPREVRERVLNHGGKRKGSITDGVYNNYSYDDEKRAALELWADALDAILGKGPAEIDSYTARLAKLKGGDLIKVT